MKIVRNRSEMWNIYNLRQSVFFRVYFLHGVCNFADCIRKITHFENVRLFKKMENVNMRNCLNEMKCKQFQAV